MFRVQGLGFRNRVGAQDQKIQNDEKKHMPDFTQRHELHLRDSRGLRQHYLRRSENEAGQRSVSLPGYSPSLRFRLPNRRNCPNPKP